MQLPQTIEIKGIKLFTTKQIAEAYETTKDKIIYNFNYNKDKYILGKHYIEVSGEELRTLKRTCEIQSSFKYAKSLYLWTERGALLHAKSLNTDKAWQVYDYLVDFYFRVQTEVVPVDVKVEQVRDQLPEKQEIPLVNNPIRVLRELMELAERRGLKVQSLPLPGYKSMLKNDRIAIRSDLPMNEVIFELAYELSHAWIHNNCGDMLKKEDWESYHMRAWKAAFMLIEALSIKVAWGK